MSDEREIRFDVDLSLRVFGMDADGRPFSQIAQTRDISDRGAKLCGLEKPVKSGEIIGVQLGGKKARCKVVSIVETGQGQKFDVGVVLLEGQASPWQNESEAGRVSALLSAKAFATKEKRRFPRHRVPFPLEIRDEQSGGARMQTNASDIGGGGCYIETRLPLPVGKVLAITLWLNSEKILIPAIVRTCDGGVGMGIEFTGLDDLRQKQLQEAVEAMARESTPFATTHGAVQ
jgi:PilZ domain